MPLFREAQIWAISMAETLFFMEQLLLKSKTRYYSRGSIIADSREESNGLIVVTAGQVCLQGQLVMVSQMPVCSVDFMFASLG
jgi:hypothetical protein